MVSELEMLWNDRMDIYHYTDVTDDDGTTHKEKPTTPTYTNIKCHYSKGSLSTAGDQSVPEIINNYMLFCGINVDLWEGDEIIVTQRNGRTVKLSVGEGFPYSDHQEFSVTRSDKV
jgi:hypothetical protein